MLAAAGPHLLHHLQQLADQTLHRVSSWCAAASSPFGLAGAVGGSMLAPTVWCRARRVPESIETSQSISPAASALARTWAKEGLWWIASVSAWEKELLWKGSRSRVPCRRCASPGSPDAHCPGVPGRLTALHGADRFLHCTARVHRACRTHGDRHYRPHRPHRGTPRPGRLLLVGRSRGTGDRAEPTTSPATAPLVLASRGVRPLPGPSEGRGPRTPTARTAWSRRRRAAHQASAPGRQDGKGEALALIGVRGGALVVHLRGGDFDGAGGGGDGARLVAAVAHHQAAPLLVAFVGEFGEPTTLWRPNTTPGWCLIKVVVAGL